MPGESANVKDEKQDEAGAEPEDARRAEYGRARRSHCAGG